MKGKLITFEGSEGSGKSTQIDRVYKYLKRKKKSVLYLREPGSVKISEGIRRILLDVKNKRMCRECETLLYMAARAQLIDERIEPALKKGAIVLCDRFLDSTVVYQGYGSGVDISFIKKIGSFVTRGLKPDLTLIFDIDAGKGLSRIQRKKDRIEQRNLIYHKKVRKGYRALAKQEPRRVKLIDSSKERRAVQLIVQKYIDQLLRG
jgi:dTMP kinase